jgi:hypothetical protein
MHFTSAMGVPPEALDHNSLVNLALRHPPAGVHQLGTNDSSVSICKPTAPATWPRHANRCKSASEVTNSGLDADLCAAIRPREPTHLSESTTRELCGCKAFMVFVANVGWRSPKERRD